MFTLTPFLLGLLIQRLSRSQEIQGLSGLVDSDPIFIGLNSTLTLYAIGRILSLRIESVYSCVIPVTKSEQDRH